MRGVDSWSMTDRDLLLILSSSGTPPQVAHAELLDNYGDELYRCCILALADRDAAHVVLRDVLIASWAHIDKVKHPDRLRDWLHAMAKAECARHRAATGAFPPSGLPGSTEMVRCRVLNGIAGPELDGYRVHVAARADDFRRDGFPRRAGEPAPLRGLFPLVPVGLALLGALLLLTLAGVVLSDDTAFGPVPGTVTLQSQR